jgi:S1-C subfamily serine protease
MSTDDPFRFRSQPSQPEPPWGHLPPRRPPEPARKLASSTFLVPLLIVLVVLLGALVVRDYWGRWFDRTEYGNPRPVTARGELSAEEKATIEIYKQTKPSVVHITSLAVHRDVLNLNVQQVPEGTGSGFVWDEGGHVVTNFHVIQKADAAQVTLADGSTYRASLVGAYPDKDLAVLHISAAKDKLQPILIGESNNLQVGQKTFAIGNPFGLDQTLTTGIVSAIGREIESVTHRPIKNVIQTDAAINPGNSGGPLLDSAGRLIGVNTAIFSPSGSSAGIGFAIPVDEVNRVVPQLIKHGKVTKPDLGVQLVPDQIAQNNKIAGAIVWSVQPDSPAAQAGLRGLRHDDQGRTRLGDVIVSIDGKPVKKVNDVYSLLEEHKVGDTVTVGLQRNGQQEEVKVTLAPAEG